MPVITKQFQNLTLPQLGFGSMRLPLLPGGGDEDVDQAAVDRMVDTAMARGANYFDTAYGYHGGKSEVVMGKALSRYPRESFFLADKFPGYDVDNIRADKVEAIFEEQLRRCGVEYFDFYLFHNVYERNVEPYLDPENRVVEYLLEQKRNGRIRHLGFSAHGALPVIRKFLDAVGEHMEFGQLQLNYLDTEEQAGLKGYHLAERMGVPVVVMEPVKGGLLAAPPEEVEELLRAARPERTPAGWALRWAASLPGVLTVLSGMGSMAQVEENLATFAGFTPLEPEETELLARAADELRRRINNGCTGCEYCMPCPAGVDIPENFSLWNKLAKCRDASLLWRSWNVVLKDEAKGKHCVGCGRCEAVCPQHLPIRADLARAQAALDSVPRP